MIPFGWLDVVLLAMLVVAVGIIVAASTWRPAPPPPSPAGTHETVCPLDELDAAILARRADGVMLVRGTTARDEQLPAVSR